jgi:CheY-like chemotaxis protein
VLIVETVPRYLEGLTAQLTSLGYRVVIARSGTEAIEKARNLQPFAIFLNPLLPQLSGWDVLTLLKSDAQTLHVPVIVTATQAEKQQAYHNKADGFLSLPVEKKALSQSLAGLGEQKGKTKKALTILHLSPELDKIPSGSFELSCDLTDTLSFEHLELNYRILEADDLEQAELLARVWHPDVVLLNSVGIADPFGYLQQFSLHTALTSLPLVTLDHQTTEAANQVTGLSVYPCLAPDNSSKKAALLQVIQVAAGMSRKPSILVMDIPESMSRRGGEIPQYKIHPPGSLISKSSSLSSPESEGTDGAKGRKSAIATPLTSHSSWLQALIQYLQTAGFRSSLSGSWTEVFRQLQDQSVDLLLICLNDMSDSVALVQRLSSLAELQQLPPILVLDHRPDAESLDEAVMSVVDSNSELELRLRAVATQVLRGSSQSMTQLLDQVYQALAVSS